MTEVPTRVTSARVASEADLDRHRSFFRTTKIGELQVEKEIVVPQKDEEWEVIAEWDAAPELPKKSTEWLGGFFGYPDEHFWPSFISWHPRSNRLFTSRDASHLTSWTPNGHRIGGRQVKGTHGWAVRDYWSSSGSWILYHGAPRFKYDGDLWSIVNNEGKLRVWINQEYFSMFAPNTRYSMAPMPAFNPWRPYADQFLTWDQSSRRFQMFDMAKFPAKVEGAANRYVAQSVDLSTLPVDDQEVENFAWHPSGKYLAFVTGSGGSARRMHLLDWDSAHVVASTGPMINMLPYTVGWSPGGQWLALDEELRIVWDIQKGEVISLSDRERRAGWARRLRNMRGHLRGYSRTSPDGERSLHPCDGTDSEYRSLGFEVHSTAGRDWLAPYGKVIDSSRCLAELPGVLDAAWSPTDPHCFATVGGPGTQRRLARIWRLKGA